MKEKIVFFTFFFIVSVFNSQSNTEKYSKVLLKITADNQSKSQKDTDQINLASERANQLWTSVNIKYEDIDSSLEQIFVAYHFYIDVKSFEKSIPDVGILGDLISKDPSLGDLIKSLSEEISRDFCSFNPLVLRQDNMLINTIEKGLTSSLNKKIDTLRSKYEPLVSPSVFNTKSLREEAINIIDREKEKSRRIVEGALITKSKKAGVSDKICDQLINLIRKKEQDLKLSKETNKVSVGAYLFDIKITKSPSEIRKEFSKNVARLITKKEYSYILKEDLEFIAFPKAKSELNKISKIYNLNKDQTNLVSKKIYTYYFEQTVIENYYSHDTRLKKQKLSGLRYYFEKDFQKTMKDFNIRLEGAKPLNNNFQF